MTKWEYHALQTAQPTASLEQLNELGAQGWEMVTVYQMPTAPRVWVYVFKRGLLT